MLAYAKRSGMSAIEAESLLCRLYQLSYMLSALVASAQRFINATYRDYSVRSCRSLASRSASHIVQPSSRRISSGLGGGSCSWVRRSIQSRTMRLSGLVVCVMDASRMQKTRTRRVINILSSGRTK